MNRKNVYVLMGAFALFATVVLVAIAGAESKKNKVADDVSEGMATVFPVTVRDASVGDMHAYIKLNGLIEADNTVDVYPEISGRYARERARLGERVSKGDIIADVDPSKPGAQYAMSAIRSPISGTITALPRRVGSMVTTETVVARVGDIDRLQVRLQIPEREISSLRIGLSAIVTVEAYPGVPFKASVYRMSPLVDPVSHTKEVCLRFERDDPRINAGMYAGIKLYTRVYADSVTVPDGAVVANYEKSYVFVVGRDDTVAMREIKKGVSIDGFTAVLKGLAEGERVVVEGANIISDGAKVRDIGKPAVDGNSGVHE